MKTLRRFEPGEPSSENESIDSSLKTLNLVLIESSCHEVLVYKRNIMFHFQKLSVYMNSNRTTNAHDSLIYEMSASMCSIL